MRRGALALSATLVVACTLTRPLDYLTDGKGAVDAAIDAPTSADGAVDAGGSSAALPSGVRAEAMAITSSDVYVAGEHSQGAGWIGQFDRTTLVLKNQIDVTLENGDMNTSLFSIATSERFGLVVGGTTTRAGTGIGIAGGVSLDLSTLSIKPVNIGGSGVIVTFAADVGGVIWTAGTLKDPAQPFFAAGDVVCPLLFSPASSASVSRLQIATGPDRIIVFANRDSDHSVSYATYNADCDQAPFPESPTPTQFDVVVVPQPDVNVVAATDQFFYAGGTYEAGAGMFFVPYRDSDGKRANNDLFELPGSNALFVSSAHDGDQLFALGTIGPSEGVLAVGSSGFITAGTKNNVMRIPDYHARAIVVAPAGNPNFYIAGGQPQSYVLRCDKTAGCPPHP